VSATSPAAASPAADAIRAAAQRVRNGDLWRVGQLAEKTGKTVRALHLYEELGLLHPATRSKGGFRLYDERSVLRVQWIDRLQELGFSLKDAAVFLADLQDHDHGPAAMDALRAFYRGKLAETHAAIARLQALEADLRDSLTYLHTCRSCADLTPVSACPACDTNAHAGQAVPSMVAAVQEPA